MRTEGKPKPTERASESQECTASIQPSTQRHQYLRRLRAQGLGQSALKSKLI
ncbi:hypothetical protein ACSS6W_006543 [Trichoderma asperelloides]